MSVPSTLLPAGGMPEVEIANEPNIIPTGRQTPTTLLDVTYSGKTATFSESTWLNMAMYQYCHVWIFSTAAWTGTTPTLQVDILGRTDDGANTLDFYNNGTHTNGFVLHIGPGCSSNILLPKNMSLSYSIGGTTPNVSFRVVVQAW